MSLIDKAAFVCASRYAGVPCVTASVQHLDFLSPIEVGELVAVEASVAYVGHTSMEIALRVETQSLTGGKRRLVNTSQVTMVAVKEGRPVPVPKLLPQTSEEKQSYMEALVRRLLKQRHSEEVSKLLEEMHHISADRLEDWLKDKKLS